MTRSETARRFLECQSEGDVDEMLALLTDDAVLNNPMRGPLAGKDAIGSELRARLGASLLRANLAEPEEVNEQVRVRQVLPPGAAIPSITYTFSFRGDLISRVEIGM